MSTSPLLSQYPHLHGVLRNDPAANAEFQKAISSLKTRRDGGSGKEEELAAAQAKVLELEKKLDEAQKTLGKALRFMQILGGVMEEQTNLHPYTQDVTDKRRYEVSFSPDQIRLALRWYWTLLHDNMEQVLRANLQNAEAEPDE